MGSELPRRRFLASLAAATVAGTGLAHYTLDISNPPHRRAALRTVPAARTSPLKADLLPPPPPGSRVPLPGGGVLYSLPGEGDTLALTVDDGANSDVVRLYTQFAADTGIRLTYFVNGMYPSWTDHRELLRPLVDSGQIQLGNHTWSHPDLRKLSASQIAGELTRNHRFLADNYGADATPFYRPPYGYHNDTVRAAAADVGYSATTLWDGSLSDSSPVTEDFLLSMADKYLTAQRIVIGHLNYLPVTHVYDQLVEIIRSRKLRTVTLRDVFL